MHSPCHEKSSSGVSPISTTGTVISITRRSPISRLVTGPHLKNVACRMCPSFHRPSCPPHRVDERTMLTYVDMSNSII
jgi:hypothetical protein